MVHPTDLVLPVETSLDPLQLVGVVMCLRNLVVLLADLDVQGPPSSFGESRQKKLETVTREQLVTVRCSKSIKMYFEVTRCLLKVII